MRRVAGMVCSGPATLPVNIHDRIDQAAKARTIPSTRQNWIFEAILEKLEREAIN